MFRKLTLFLFLICVVTPAAAQLVCLPAPRILTIMPMGGQTGSTVEVTITGQNIENVTALLFSTPEITAKPVIGPDGAPSENKFVVTISAAAPVGVHDVRVMSRLGISSARAFSVGTLPELTRSEANNSMETAMEIPVNSICNAVMTQRMIDFYSFKAEKDKRVSVECAAVGIDSKLTPVVIIADAQGRDLMVNRTGGILDFTPPASGDYVIKVNDLTYQGSARHFYRLALQGVSGDGPVRPQPATLSVSSMSWPPAGISATAPAMEAEPNNAASEAEKVQLPLDVEGSFFPASDVDTFEFSAKKGEVWWVEVGSERMGLPTDPFVLVQSVTMKDGKETLADVAELYDIKSPLKVSSNGYSYDGPPYDVGSPDVLGSVEIKEDGVYRLQLRDLFGGTRNVPTNRYRLIVRKAAPDFAITAWAVHLTLRNGDRAAFSKPMALRAGGAMTLEVLAIRRDGFDGDIDMKMEGLPAGVTATSLKIAAGKSVGHVILTADENAKPSFSLANITGHATINDKAVTHPCRLASMEWPVKDAKQEIPAPRLVADIPVSISPSEKAPLSIAASEDKVWEATVGETLKIPLAAVWREEFSGTSVKFKVYGAGFEKAKGFEIPLKAETHEAEIDLAALKVAPGEYTVAFYGGGIAKYRYNPDAVKVAEEAQTKAEKEAAAVAEEAKKLAAGIAGAPDDKKAAQEAAAKAAAEKAKLAEATMAKATTKMKAVTAAAAPKDIVDIYVSKPIRIVVKPAPTEPAAAEVAEKK
ncbi:MAG: hypothetical protein ACI8UO_002261 [Verrucomicrobiales bacterium]|jgi:hypothetical protein